MKFRVKYPNLTLFGTSILIVTVLSRFDIFDKVFGDIGSLGFLGAFIAGILFPITLTSPFAVASLYYLGGHIGLPMTVVFGGIGAVIGDLLIYSFIKDGTIVEIEEIYKQYKTNHPTHDKKGHRKALLHLFHSKFFHALGLFVGGLLIMLPTPDELGIAVLSSYKLSRKKFIFLSLVLNTISVWIVATLGAR